MALEKEFQYFLDHQDVLVEKYEGRFVVIVGDEVVGDYESASEAYFDTQDQGHELGTFLIQQAIAGEEAYTTTITNAVFA